ncbi:hypothetical protein CA603_17305 [Paraburkholderia hospita]|nr:hypothetical protein CA603_17305 [Paraburkholderia hospita]
MRRAVFQVEERIIVVFRRRLRRIGAISIHAYRWARVRASSWRFSVFQNLQSVMNLAHGCVSARALTLRLFNMRAPGGTLSIAKFPAGTPDADFMEVAMDWWLIYRDEKQMLALLSGIADSDMLQYNNIVTPITTFPFSKANLSTESGDTAQKKARSKSGLQRNESALFRPLRPSAS